VFQQAEERFSPLPPCRGASPRTVPASKEETGSFALSVFMRPLISADSNSERDHKVYNLVEATMLIREKLPQGHIYPQITQAPTLSS
jgi:hypothetical protein